jgi:uncharacterized protein YndB with AHSA1/START domain
MTGDAPSPARILGSLRSEDGQGVVRMEDHFDTHVDDLWSALTDPRRLARWYGRTEGDLRLGGAFRLLVDGSGWEGTGRVEVCEPPRRLVVTTRELDRPFDVRLEATLAADGDGTILVIEARGLPMDKVHFYGAGWQVNVENLAAYVTDREREVTDISWAELVRSYQGLADDIAR